MTAESTLQKNPGFYASEINVKYCLLCLQLGSSTVERNLAAMLWQYRFYDMRQAALLSLQRQWRYGFLSPSKVHCPQPGLNPRLLGPMTSTLLLDHRGWPLDILYSVTVISYSFSFICRTTPYWPDRSFRHCLDLCWSSGGCDCVVHHNGFLLYLYVCTIHVSSHLRHSFLNNTAMRIETRRLKRSGWFGHAINCNMFRYQP
jgi:hypothetical protein